MRSCCTGFDKWNEYIARGNTEFSLQYYGNAILMFTQALDQARFDYENAADKSHLQAISKVVVCHFNLADCYIALEEIERACDYYEQAQRFLLRVSEEPTDCSKQLNKAVTHADAHMNTVWSGFVKKYQSEISYKRMLQFHKTAIILSRAENAAAIHH